MGIFRQSWTESRIAGGFELLRVIEATLAQSVLVAFCAAASTKSS